MLVGLAPNSGAAMARATPTARILFFPEHAGESDRIVDDHLNRAHSIVCAGEHVTGVDQRWPISPCATGLPAAHSSRSATRHLTARRLILIGSGKRPARI
ncbi:MAG: hypothetical protein OXI20_20865 [Rhodospirillales bacterium]|nr:hypothetical protein [Rhodospirillales bacterium]